MPRLLHGLSKAHPPSVAGMAVLAALSGLPVLHAPALAAAPATSAGLSSSGTPPVDRQPALAACGQAVEQAVAGTVPAGAARWGLTREGLHAAVATAADPSVPDYALRRAVKESVLRATPWLEETLRLETLRTVQPQILDVTPPTPRPVGGTPLLFRCTIRNDGSGWAAYELQMARSNGGTWLAFPLIDPDSAF